MQEYMLNFADPMRLLDQPTYYHLLWKAEQDMQKLPRDIQIALSAKWEMENSPFEQTFIDIQNAILDSPYLEQDDLWVF
ncbi:MAG: hypothetical protein OEZ36_01350 [Spirochaetota bacterium]|nr:hypothetical protein [Spirochaetota bacterium]